MKAVPLVLLASFLVPLWTGRAQQREPGKDALRQASSPVPSKIAEAFRVSARMAELYKQGKYREALPLAEEALRLAEEATGPNDERLALFLSNLGTVRYELKEYDRAEKLLLRALAICDASGRGCPERMANIYHTLGLIYFARRDGKRSETYFRRALEAREVIDGPDSPATAQAAFTLGEFYDRGMVNYAKAEPLYGRAASIWEKDAIKNNDRLITALERQRCLLILQNKEEAAKEIERKLDTIEMLADPSHAQDAMGRISKGKAKAIPAPVYPPSAKQQRIEGKVIIKVLVDEQGRVSKAEVLCGHPALAEAALEAAKLAVFEPTFIGGRPVEVSGWLEYNFTLR